LNANKSIDSILDIHFNANMIGATGVEAIVHPNTSEENKQLAASMVYVLSGIIEIPIRRREPDRDYIFPSETPRGTLAMIDQTKAPAIIIEVCFLNENDMSKYRKKRTEVAKALRKLMFV
jgi:N-acetylmuramoyl-L-alanine amidase